MTPRTSSSGTRTTALALILMPLLPCIQGVAILRSRSDPYRQIVGDLAEIETDLFQIRLLNDPAAIDLFLS